MDSLFNSRLIVQKNAPDPSREGRLTRPRRYARPEDARKYDHHIRAGALDRRVSHRLEIRAFKKALQRIEGCKALDAPCGTGRIHLILKNKFAGVISLDSSQNMLLVHRQQQEAADLCCANVFDLPFPDDSFDWAICYRLFHHMQERNDRLNLLRSLQRISRQGIIFTAWIDTPLNRRRKSRRRTISRHEISGLISQADMDLRAIDFVLWPLQPKCVITCNPMSLT